MILLLLLASNLLPQDHFPIPPPRDDAQLGVGIQRTMTLLATSTPEKRNKVRILFYGQSITEQDWWKTVAADLRRRYPSAELEIENRALGGFASQILVRVAEHDLYPFYPDLVVFHVYGAHTSYEEILKNIRSRTTSEILLQRDHAAQWPADPPDEKKDKGLWWDHMMNDVFLPDFAKKHRCGLADVRGGWLDYLRANQLEPKALLKDGVHLNDHGNYLMAELLKRALVYRPELPVDGTLVRTVEIPPDGRLEFEGNRVDLVGDGAAEVRIDGKRPSELAALRFIPRVSPSQAGFWPAILRVSHTAPLEIEEWTVTVTECNDEVTQFKFAVEGSKTGADGEGTNKETFTSRSGRVVIEPGDWWVTNARQWVGAKMPPGFKIRWTVRATAVDRACPSKGAAVTVAQGLPNGRHTLELLGAKGVSSVRIYRPPGP